MDQMTISAILWDFGGVLTTSPFEAFNRFEAEHGIPADFIRRIYATNPDGNAWAQFESSAIGLNEFDEAFARESAAQGHRIPGRKVLELLSGELRPRMVEALHSCKVSYQVACITNNVKSGQGPAMASNRARAAAMEGVMALFDLVVESSIEGIRKPDPRIYELTCERLGVRPEQAVFLDDLGVNLKPARALGMHTIKVVEESQALEELGSLTGLAL
jgi:putative hydrolase of the HAD superfamily